MQLERDLNRYVRQIRPGLLGATSNPNTNLIEVIEEFKAEGHHNEPLIQRLRDFLMSRDYVQALTETGLTLEAGALTEIYKRLEYKILPKEIDERDVLGLIAQVFDSQSDAAWLEKIDREKFSEFLKLLIPEKDQLIEHVGSQLFLSLEILGLRLAGLGYDPVVTHRLRERREYQHCFTDVTRHVYSLLDGKGLEALPKIHEALNRTLHAVRWARAQRGKKGISLQLTYRLMKIQQVVRRMQLLLDLIDSVLGEWKTKPAQDLFFEIVLAEIRRFDLSRFMGQNVELLAFQITEHTGKAGEHYITRNRHEWKAMFKSACLGGVVVAILAILKVLIAKLHLPVGPEAFAFGTLYAAGFVFLHHVGATLATKQPAMTASTLASSLDEAKNSHQAMENLSDVIIRTIRSQMVALFGNYFAAFPAAALFCLPFYLMKTPLMDHGKAWAMMDSMHMLHSLSLFYAAVAGVCLFVSGLLAGFADNWFVFNRVGTRLKQSELLSRLVGPQNLDRAIHTIDHNLGFWVGAISLGYFLGSTGAIGQIFGLPLDIRHITFSSATFGASVASMEFRVPVGIMIWVAVTILLIGLVNLGVSFSLTLFLAIKSRRIKFSQTPELLGLLGRRFREHPLDFFIPLRDSK